MKGNNIGKLCTIHAIQAPLCVPFIYEIMCLINIMLKMNPLNRLVQGVFLCRKEGVVF